MAIDHYSKWCEAKHVKKHIITTTMKFIEKIIICKFGIPNYAFTNIGESAWLNLI
jgi:hypothetical protein